MIDFNQKTIYDNLKLNELETILSSCQKCSLATTRTNVVIGTKNYNAPIMIIGEAPGETEDIKGQPFIGRSGQLLSTLLKEATLNQEKDTFITNIIKCRPPKNRNPKKHEISQCNAYLIRQIQLIEPKLLLLLGSPSMKIILGDHYKITEVRGQWFSSSVNYMNTPLKIMPLFHPSYLLRFSSLKKGSPKWLTQKDFNEVKDQLIKLLP